MSDPAVVRVRIDGELRTGRAIDLRTHSFDPSTVAAAVREESPLTVRAEEGATDSAGAEDSLLAVDCPAPGPVHDHVGYIAPSMGLRVRTALAAAARSRGGEAPNDPELERVESELADLTVPSQPDLQGPRERVAGTDAAVERSRERVAALRGRVQAGREAGRDVSDLEAELTDAMRELSEHETERAAAREALDRAERLARETRDARERRRRLEDRRANLRRRARAHLVDRIREEFDRAVERVPGRDTDDSVDDCSAVESVTGALAVARIAAVDAPLVLACDRFETPDAAASWLDASVIVV